MSAMRGRWAATHAAFERLTAIPRREQWHIVFDEAPQVDYSERFSLNENASILLNLFDPISTAGGRYLPIMPKDDGRVQGVAQNRTKDMVDGLFQNFAAKLANPHFSLYVLKDQHLEELFRDDAQAFVDDCKVQPRPILDVRTILYPPLEPGSIAPRSTRTASSMVMPLICATIRPIGLEVARVVTDLRLRVVEFPA
jgi:hypothetical protein